MKANETCFYINLGSFNVRGITSATKQEQLIKDFESYKLDILCVQETKIKNGGDWISTHGHRMVLFDTQCRHYGNGFVIRKSLVPSLQKSWKISDRLCAIQIGLNINNSESQGKVTSLTIINAYAPTSALTKNNPNEADKFYYELQKLLKTIGNNTFIIIAGDFNAKVGQKKEGESCIGTFSRGYRNENGDCLVDFCENNKLFITNSAFNKAARHITTWVGTRKDKNGNTVHIYNQIDYIICKQSRKHLITNSQSYGGTTVTSDHKLVKTSFKLTPYNIWKPSKKNKNTLTTKRDRSQLIQDEAVKNKYQEQLHGLLKQNDQNETVTKQWEHIQNSINVAVEDNIEEIAPMKPYQPWDKEIEQLSALQKNLRLKIQNCKNEKETEKLKKERNSILHKIRNKTIELSNSYLDKLAEDIDKSTSDGGMFKAVKNFYRKKYDNPKVEDKDGKHIINPDDMHRIVTDHFKTKFRSDNISDIQPFSGQPRPLSSPITKNEVRTSINRLNNGKSPGEDGIYNEYLKFAPEILDEQVANILNRIFETHESIGINKGIMITIPKPGKPKGPPQNLRPITLLNSIRKVLSTIALNRIRPNVEEYVSLSQSGFRPNRSTSDVVWAHRWITAKVLCSHDLQINITGLDMSAAFDTIDRNKLLEILENLVADDELRIIRYLLSETTINIKINGNETDRPFNSNIGTPQGDSLSPVLFIIYLEHALKEVRGHTQTKEIMDIPTEIIYADDIDFIGENHADVGKIERILQNYNLKVNVDKTEFTTIRKDVDDWKTSKKVGSLLGSKEDIEHRKHLSNLALNKLTSIWNRADKIKQKTRIKIYNSLVKSILLYNCGTWGLTKTEENKLDAFHRKQLRRVLGIHYPTKISNESLYKRCKETPLSIQILEARWKLFGHILRRDPEIPANKAIEFYYTQNTKRTKGRPMTTLPVTLNNDLKKLQNNMRLTTITELDKLKSIARDRKEWFAFSREVRRTAEADKSDDQDSERFL